MKRFSVVWLVALAGLSWALPEMHGNKYGLDDVLGDRQLLVPYIQCVLDEGPCMPEGLKLKSHIIESLEGHCASCNENHIAGVKKVFKHLVNKEPEYWKQMCDKYDPDRKYSKKYEDELREV